MANGYGSISSKKIDLKREDLTETQIALGMEHNANIEKIDTLWVDSLDSVNPDDVAKAIEHVAVLKFRIATAIPYLQYDVRKIQDVVDNKELELWKLYKEAGENATVCNKLSELGAYDIDTRKLLRIAEWLLEVVEVAVEHIQGVIHGMNRHHDDLAEERRSNFGKYQP